MTSVRRLAVISVITFVTPFVLLYMILLLDPHGNSGREIKLLRPHMALDEIQRTLGRPPEFICLFGEYQVVYYISQGIPPDRREILPLSVDSREDIPEVYDSLQILVNDEGLAVAFTHMGEKMTIETTEGPFAGSNVGLLPDVFFQRNSNSN